MDDTPRDASGNRTDLRPIQLFDDGPAEFRISLDKPGEVVTVVPRSARRMSPVLPYTPEVDDNMGDDELRRRVDRANVQVADHLLHEALRGRGGREIPDVQSNRLAGEAMLRDVEGLEARARELDKVLRKPGETRQEGD